MSLFRYAAPAGSAAARDSGLATAVAAMVALAVAMGIGRFAFTPLLPMMLSDQPLDLNGAAWLASANYLGYWLGAMGCAAQAWWWARRSWPPLSPVPLLRAGLVATVLLTAAMAVPWPAAWPWWRFGAGVASAVVFVYSAAWCLGRLANAGVPALGGLMFVGPGLGIALSGLAASALVAWAWGSGAAWLLFALLAAAMTAWAWPRFLTSASAPLAAPMASGGAGGQGAVSLLVLAYGLAGLGYIVSATFLPVIARLVVPGSAWIDLFWPLFGLSVALGSLFTLRLPSAWDRRVLLLAAYAVQTAGLACSVWWSGWAGLALGSALLGLPFTAITLFALQEARRLRPQQPAGLIAALTAAYGFGQIVGPPLAAALLTRHSSPGPGFVAALQAAGLALCLGMALLAWLRWRHPQGERVA